jgi:hypothetical protein
MIDAGVMWGWDEKGKLLFESGFGWLVLVGVVLCVWLQIWHSCIKLTAVDHQKNL